MNVLLWAVACALALVFLASGLVKVSQPKARLAVLGMRWTERYPADRVQEIGAVELLAAAGLILPGVMGVAPVLVPLTAVGLAVLMTGAAVVHARRGEFPMIALNAALLALAAFEIWGRLGPYSFGLA